MLGKKPGRLQADENLGYFLIAPSLLVLSVFALFPVLQTVWLSFHRVILTLPAMGESFVGLDNYRVLLQDASFLNSYVTKARNGSANRERIARSLRHPNYDAVRPFCAQTRSPFGS